MTMGVPDKKTIEEAHVRIKKYIHKTPVMTSASVDEQAGCSVFFKCENFQKVGAFKGRGAMNAVLQLSEEQRKQGVVTHSSGNHGQALARAANVVGLKSYIIMPRTAPEIKKRGVLGYGGEIFECEPTLQAREKMLAEVRGKTGAYEIHPFNNYEVIAGQATAAKELMEEIPNLDIMVAPVGGGGLLSGTLLTVHYFAPEITVVAAEPEGADDTYRSVQSGKIELSQADTIADGLLTSLGDKTFPLIKKYVKGVVTVSDKEIVAAMRLVWEKVKIIIEPSAAVAVAAVLKDPQFKKKKVGVILSGGNVDLERACKLFAAEPS